MLLGIHHPQTKKVAGILTDDEEGYPAIAAELGDSLPSDDHLEGMDLDYEERLKLLLKLDLDGNGSSDCEDDEDKSEWCKIINQYFNFHLPVYFTYLLASEFYVLFKSAS